MTNHKKLIYAHADLRLDIATGNRNFGKVHNKEIRWLDHIHSLAKPCVTTEKFAAYIKLPKSEQDTLKGRPGFWVGGPCDNGRRAADAIRYRSVITLDSDEVPAKILDHLQEGLTGISGYEFVVHSTRKHTPDKPRLRIAIPLKKPIAADKYDAVARIIASKLDPSMDSFDDVSFRAPQMMFYPSCSADSEFFFLHNQGELLDGEKILEEFGDWQDHTRLPYSERYGQKRPSAKEAQDPRTKQGYIGAFCRAYPIEGAINRFIPDTYIPSAKRSGKPRYTYTGGSTANGAVVEDGGLFLYSHHSTDPCSGRLVNAFDLIRIHRFGILDWGKREDTSPAELPSFKAMVEFIRNDAAVLEEYKSNLADTFDDVPDVGRSAVDPDMTILQEARISAPEFPLHLFHVFWRHELKIMADNAAAPVDFVACALLVTTGALIGNARWVRVHQNWAEPPVLWGQVVGNPSTNKSPAFTPFIRLIDRIEAAGAPAFAEAHRQWQTEKKRSEKKRKIWEAKFEKAVEEGQEPPAMPADAIPPPEPVPYRAYVGDVTLEALIRTLAGNPRGLLNFRDEMTTWYGNLARYSGGSDRPAWIEAYGGRPYRMDRVKDSGKVIHVPRFTVGILGGIQPEPLKEMLESADDGLQARFIPFWPDKAIRKLNRRSFDERNIQLAFERIAKLKMRVQPDGTKEPIYVPFSEEAFMAFADWSDARKANEQFAPARLAGPFGKAEGHVARIALIFEMLDWMQDLFDEDACPTEVSSGAVRRAIKFRESYIKPMQERLYSHGLVGDELRTAKRIAEWIVNNRVSEFNLRKLRREGGIPGISNRTGHDLISEAIAYLESIGWVAPTEHSPSPKGGRPPGDYCVNNRIWELLEEMNK